MTGQGDKVLGGQGETAVRFIRHAATVDDFAVAICDRTRSYNLFLGCDGRCAQRGRHRVIQNFLFAPVVELCQFAALVIGQSVF
jgi:hypothetical protein